MPTPGVWSYLSLTRRGAKRKNAGELVMFTDIHARMLLRRLVAGKAAAELLRACLGAPESEFEPLPQDISARFNFH